MGNRLGCDIMYEINYRKCGSEVLREAYFKYRAEKLGLAHAVDFVAGWNACLASLTKKEEEICKTADEHLSEV